MIVTMGSDKDTVEKLDYNNHETWFREMEYKLQGKGIFFVVQQSKSEYAWIKRLADDHSNTPDTSTTGRIDGIDGLMSKFEKLGGSWNIEKAEKYDMAQGK